METMIGILITSFLFVIVIGVLISKYNNLSKNKNQIQNSISSLDALFIKRSDLIPNLVTVVKQYMSFETETLEKITALRNVSPSTNPLEEKEGVRALKSIMIQVESYPELKANTQFTSLQYSWNEIEEQISAGRRYVSSSITLYNNSVTTFPSNIVASLTSFTIYKWEYATTEQKQNIIAKDLF